MADSDFSNEILSRNVELQRRIKRYKNQIVSLNELISRINGLNSFNEKMEIQETPELLLKTLKDELDKLYEVSFCSVFFLKDSELGFLLRADFVFFFLL